MVDAVKFRRLVACLKGYSKSADPDQTASTEAVLIYVFPVSYFDRVSCIQVV